MQNQRLSISIRMIPPFWFLLVLTSFLSGCNTAPITLQQTLTGQEGAVVVKLITNSVGETDPAEKLFMLQLERVLTSGVKRTGSDLVTLARTRRATFTTAVFSGLLQPGRYIIKSAQGNDGRASYSFPIDEKFGSFEVVRGEVSLLGTLLIQPTVGMHFAIGYTPPDEEFRQTFQRLYPALAAQTLTQPTHGFTATVELQRRAALVPAIRRRATLWNGMAQTADGEFMAGAKLGKVLWHKAGSANWRELDVNTTREVLGARPYRGGILAFGEEGLMRFSRDDGATWTDMIPPDHGLIQLAQQMRDGRLVVLSRNDRVWTVYVAEDVDAGQWKKAGDFPDSISINIPLRPIIVSLPDAVGIMMSDGELYMTDGTAVRHSSDGRTTVAVASAPDGTLIASTASLPAATIISKDAGKTWKDLPVNRFTTKVFLKDAQTGYALAALTPGVFARDMALVVTHDGAKTWSRAGPFPNLSGPNGIRQMFVDRTDGSLIALRLDNAVARSTDEGRSWPIVKER